MSDCHKLVSVIVPFFNSERFIQETIASVFAQTYDRWELLLVDDGSTDRSQTIAKNFEREYPDRIRYLQHANRQNHGCSASRNLGIDNARGEYIAFLDADDVWLPDKLSRQVNILESQPAAAMVYCKYLFWHNWHKQIETDRVNTQSDYVIPLGLPSNSLVQPSQILVPFLQSRIQQPIPSCIMVRREVFTAIGRFEDDFRHTPEDKVFIIKILVAAPIFVADELLIKYRQHEDSWCSTVQKSNVFFEDWHAYLNWVAKYLVEFGIRDRLVWQALWQQKLRYSYPLFYYLSDPQEMAVRIGRLILPKKLRHWLWVTFSGHQVMGTNSG
jgi:glycosyltransferase involved in cell wall biosynthesis